ncbi:MAG: helix-turn-helix transcriptional regulator [Lachnospiraceae bacterium]|nr:helix-turn-helix transcriptional regulator [Lachnospiraceae bacterium]
MNFGEKVRHYRKEKGLSQTALAERAEVTMRTIQSYEAGKSYPKSRETYHRLAEVLGLDPNFLMTEEDYFVAEANAQYGPRGAAQAKELLSQVGGLFAGGELAEEDMDEMMQAIQEAYWMAKRNNRKYSKTSRE